MITRANFILRRLLIPGLLTGLLACQEVGTPDEENGRTVGPPAVSPTPAPSETPEVQPAELGQSGLTGRVFAESDVSGLPDSPLAAQMLLVIPMQNAGEILGQGSGHLTDRELRFLKASLPQPNPAIAVATSDSDGKYTLLLDPGEYILCVGDSEATPADFPVTTRGCGRTQVRPGELRRVDVSSGFGEILLVE